MHKQNFRKQIILSSILTAIAVVFIVVLFISMFKQYSPPSENNTTVISDTVTEVYLGGYHYRDIKIATSNGDPLILVSPYSHGNLYSTIGYDIEELADLLKGKFIKYRRMNDLPWAVEIYVGDAKIDNTKLTIQQIYVTRIAIVILGLFTLAFPIVGEVMYLKSKYHTYQKAERKRIKKEKRKSKLMAKQANKTK